MLTKLDLSQNLLNTLPKSFGNLIQLTTLKLQDSRFKTLPQSIGKLTNLKKLEFDYIKPEVLMYIKSLLPEDYSILIADRY